MTEQPDIRRHEFVLQKERQFDALCRQHGLSQTVQRRAILAALARRTDHPTADHPTADHLYDELHPQFGGLSRTTVYRVLETFAGESQARNKYTYFASVARKEGYE